MNPQLYLILLFAIGWIVLYKSKVERHYNLFYLIRSGYGIRLIDRLSKIRPKAWTFLADLSVLLSFGGLGAYYLSTTRETRANLLRSIMAVGMVAACVGLLAGISAVMVLACVIALAIMVWGLNRTHSATVDFTASSCFIFFMSMVATRQLPLSLLMGVFGLPSLIVYALVSHGITILYGKTDLPGITPMIPATDDGSLGVAFPGYDIFIPWWYALIAIVVTLVSHEAAHGVLARVCGVKLNSTGILTVGSLPVGAFVEPDEEALNAKSSVDRMRVYTMGSFANFVVGIVAALVLMSATTVLADYLDSDGVRVVGFIEGYPAGEVLAKDSVITSINGMPTRDIAGFKNATSGLAAGERISMNTSSGSFTFLLGENKETPGKGYMGVYVTEDVYFTGALSFLDLRLVSFLIKMFEWIIFFNLNIALVNLMPVIPFDGGRMFKEIISSLNLTELNVRRVLYTIIVLTAVIFMVNTIPLFYRTVNFVYGLFGLA